MTSFRVVGRVIHRHTGGLEKSRKPANTLNLIHRHTGGLEMYVDKKSDALLIHRHTGGLENRSKNMGV